ncbi:COMM domain-containing protein 4 isoform X5 [Eptesicus fuscus]|uniref:COMM domain-containing protein 4 isoform X5 n=1 Tax=Eptesicus fuscus TaxID=29078 RepID=UPI0024047274|nr:COMM domain-containing protein 4 isoform X5 [Eptesicus fuscus]
MHYPNWKSVNRRLVKGEAGQVSRGQRLLGLQSHVWTLRRGHWQVRNILLRFRFCGDLDCPDWVLAEISTLAKISSVKLRLLCGQVLQELLGLGMDYEKVQKLTADARFELGDVKATVAVLSFILSSAAKHSVDGESLSSELQQLGLPKEHAASLCRCYEEKQSPLQEYLRACSLRGWQAQAGG